LVIPEPPRKAFDTALGFGAIGHVGRNVGQLRALTGHNATDERREGGQVPADRACSLARIPLCSGFPYGTIPAEVVTHCLLLLDWPRFPEEVYKRDNLLNTYFTMTWQKCPVEKSIQMHDLVIGLFINRFAYGRAIMNHRSTHLKHHRTVENVPNAAPVDLAAPKTAASTISK